MEQNCMIVPEQLLYEIVQEWRGHDDVHELKLKLKPNCVWSAKHLASARNSTLQKTQQSSNNRYVIIMNL